MASYSEKDIDTEEEFEWKPPTEAEMKINQARRERSDRIAKIMGSYLLKGYKMLASQCPKCGTILLQDRREKLYCVGCEDVDSDILKDDPALNEKAASSQLAQQQFTSEKPQVEKPQVEKPQAEKPQAEKPRDLEYEKVSATMATAFAAMLTDEDTQVQPAVKSTATQSCREKPHKIEEECSKCLETVLKKLSWSRLAIESELDPNLVAAHLKVIANCTEAISGLQKFTK